MKKFHNDIWERFKDSLQPKSNLYDFMIENNIKPDTRHKDDLGIIKSNWDTNFSEVSKCISCSSPTKFVNITNGYRVPGTRSIVREGVPQGIIVNLPQIRYLMN